MNNLTERNGVTLEIKALHLTREDREILRGVDLTVLRGTVHALLGLNGSGKSTLAYTLMGCGSYTPDSGAIVLDGVDITRLSITERARQGLTLAWQEPARFEGLTVARYLGLGMKTPDMARIHRALEAVALNPTTYLGRYVDESLSGGERKRVELAAIYAMQPKLAILDEPDSGIDALSLADISRLIHQMAEEGTTVLLISHRDEVVAIADVASLICAGRIVDTGDPANVGGQYTSCCQPCDRMEVVEAEVAYEQR